MLSKKIEEGSDDERNYRIFTREAIAMQGTYDDLTREDDDNQGPIDDEQTTDEDHNNAVIKDNEEGGTEC